MSPIITRFAPSPSGDLHLGHAYSVWLIEQFVQGQRALGVTVSEPLLRWEDIDHTRCSLESEQSIIEDLTWLGFSYNESQPVLRQSERLDVYAQALATLIKLDVVYPCFCTRKQIKEAIGKQEIDQILNAPQAGQATQPHYAGTCLKLSSKDRAELLASNESYAWRFNSQKAQEILTEKDLYFDDLSLVEPTKVNWSLIHDDVLARKELQTSYHLAVIIDDDAQQVTHAIRGEDLRETTHLHRVLQQLLKLRTPSYIHHPLLYNEQGKRLSKRDKSTTIKQLKTQYPTGEKLFEAQANNPQWKPLEQIMRSK